MNLWIWLPNALSICRFLLGLAFPLVPEGARFLVLALAALSDWADGAASRWLRVESDLGRLLDPAADKGFLLCVLLTLLADGTLSPLDVVLVGFRDVLLGVGALLILIAQGQAAIPRLKPTLLGKATTVAQLLFLLVVLVWGRSLAFGFLVGAAVLGGWATLDYGWRFLRSTRKEV